MTGDYAFTIGGGGRGPVTHLFLDDKESTQAQLEAGRAYSLRVEFKPQNAGNTMQLSWLPPADPLLAEALDAVKGSDLTVAFVGLNPNLEGEEMRVSIPGFAGGDRTNLEVPESQEKLIEAAMATGKPVVVVLTSGSALSANYPAAHAAAKLQHWYGGEEAGTAIAETLAGVNNPSGRLPVTFYKSVDQLPPFDDYSMNGRTYRYFKGDALYTFGFGLSYSKFQYSGLRAQRKAEGGQVTVRVKNESAREGDEVVQLYVDDGTRSLRGFQRVHLRGGETREVQFALDAGSLPKGKVKVSVGGGQPVGAIPHVDAVM